MDSSWGMLICVLTILLINSISGNYLKEILIKSNTGKRKVITTILKMWQYLEIT